MGRSASSGSRSLWEGLWTGLGVVADVDALHKIENVLGDVGGMVRYALEIAGHEHEADALGNRVRSLLHRFDKLLVDRVAQVIDGVVGNETKTHGQESADRYPTRALESGRHRPAAQRATASEGL